MFTDVLLITEIQEAKSTENEQLSVPSIAQCTSNKDQTKGNKLLRISLFRMNSPCQSDFQDQNILINEPLSVVTNDCVHSPMHI